MSMVHTITPSLYQINLPNMQGHGNMGHSGIQMGHIDPHLYTTILYHVHTNNSGMLYGWMPESPVRVCCPRLCGRPGQSIHYNDVIVGAMASQITSLSRLIRRRSKKISKIRVTGLCTGNSPETGEFPAQRASNAENVSIWWRHHDYFVRWAAANRDSDLCLLRMADSASVGDDRDFWCECKRMRGGNGMKCYDDVSDSASITEL